MAQHARGNGANDKRALLASAANGQHNAYVHEVASRKGAGQDRTPGQDVRPPQEPPQNPRPALSKMTIGQFIREFSVYILGVAAVALVVVLLIVGIRAFGGLAAPSEGEHEGPYESPYDWSNLELVDGRYAYVVNGQVKSRLGVDVWENQGDIDWEAVAADGIDFAILRIGYRGATEGDLYLDERFYEYLAGAKAAGLDCGVYFFSQAVNEEEGREEARFVLESLAGVSLECPVAYDFEHVSSLGETRTANLSNEELSDIADAFCDTIDAAGYSTMLYGNAGDLRSYEVDALRGRSVWWAEYDTSEPAHYLDIAMWQFTSAGTVNGIPGEVDLNLDLTPAL